MIEFTNKKPQSGRIDGKNHSMLPMKHHINFRTDFDKGKGWKKIFHTSENKKKTC